MMESSGVRNQVRDFTGKKMSDVSDLWVTMVRGITLTQTGIVQGVVA